MQRVRPSSYAALGTAQGHLLGFPITLERICVLLGEWVISKFSFHVFKINFFLNSFIGVMGFSFCGAEIQTHGIAHTELVCL